MMKRNEGFTLVELIVSIAIASLIMMAATSTMLLAAEGRRRNDYYCRDRKQRKPRKNRYPNSRQQRVHRIQPWHSGIVAERFCIHERGH